MRLLATTVVSLLVVACSGSPAAPTPTAAAPGDPTASPVASGLAGTGGPGTATATPRAPAPTGQPGGVTGPAYTGDLTGAFPRLIGGQPVQVVGPMSPGGMDEDDWESLPFKDVLPFLAEMGADPAGAEIAYATDSGNSAIIFALRVPGVDSATLDSTFIAGQEAAPGTGSFRVVSVAGRNVHAWNSLIGTTYAWVNGDILFWLYGSEDGMQQAVAAMPLPTVPLQAGGEELPNAEVELVVTGGPHAGSYRGVTPGSGGCTRNTLADNQFGLQYSNENAPDGFTSLQLVINDAAGAALGTENFFATFQIGPMSSGTTYDLDPGDGDGTGTATLLDGDGDSARVQISGETADGIQLEATVACNLVVDFGSDD